MSYIFPKNRRHRRLAERTQCGHAWVPRERDADHPEHRCEAFAGHVGPHRCRCGGGTPGRRPGAPSLRGTR